MLPVLLVCCSIQFKEQIFQSYSPPSYCRPCSFPRQFLNSWLSLFHYPYISVFTIIIFFLPIFPQPGTNLSLLFTSLSILLSFPISLFRPIAFHQSSLAWKPFLFLPSFNPFHRFILSAGFGISDEKKVFKADVTVISFFNVDGNATQVASAMLCVQAYDAIQRFAAPHAKLNPQIRGWQWPHSCQESCNHRRVEIPCIPLQVLNHKWLTSYYSRSPHSWCVGMGKSGNDA